MKKNKENLSLLDMRDEWDDSFSKARREYERGQKFRKRWIVVFIILAFLYTIFITIHAKNLYDRQPNSSRTSPAGF